MEVLGVLWSDLVSLESLFFALVADRQVENLGPSPMVIHDPAGLEPLSSCSEHQPLMAQKEGYWSYLESCCQEDSGYSCYGLNPK